MNKISCIGAVIALSSLMSQQPWEIITSPDMTLLVTTKILDSYKNTNPYKARYSFMKDLRNLALTNKAFYKQIMPLVKGTDSKGQVFNEYILKFLTDQVLYQNTLRYRGSPEEASYKRILACALLGTPYSLSLLKPTFREMPFYFIKDVFDAKTFRQPLAVHFYDYETPCMSYNNYYFYDEPKFEVVYKHEPWDKVLSKFPRSTGMHCTALIKKRPKACDNDDELKELEKKYKDKK